MTDPVSAFATLQSAMLEGWFRTAHSMTECWRRSCDAQLFLLNSAGRHRSQAEIPSGPSLTDKYGRRCHDIDPERDV